MSDEFMKGLNVKYELVPPLWIGIEIIFINDIF